MDGYVKIGTKLDTKSFDAQIDYISSQLDEIENKLKQADMGFDVGDTQKLEAKYETLSTKLTTLTQKKKDFDKADLSNANEQISKMGEGISKVTGKVTRWILAVFSVRSAYMAVIQAMDILSSTNENLARQLDSIKLIFATALEPIVNFIVDIVSTGIAYLNLFIKALSGVDIIANANAKAIAQQAKKQKDLNKQIASFDEINKVSSKNTANTNQASTFETPKLDDAVVKKLQDLAYWIKENKDLLEALGIAFVAVFGAVAIGKLIGNISEFLGAKGLSGLSSAIEGIIEFGAIAITFYIASKIFDDIENLKKEIDGVNEKAVDYQSQWLENETNINDIIQTQNVNRTAGYNLIQESNGLLNSMVGLTQQNLDTLQNTVINSQSQLDKEQEIYHTKQLTNDEQTKYLTSLINGYLYSMKVVERLEQAGVDTTELKQTTENYSNAINEVGNGLGLSNDKLNDMIWETDQSKDNMNQTFNSLEDLNNTRMTDKEATYTITAQADTAKASKDYSSFFSKLGSSLSSVFDPDAWSGSGGLWGSIKRIWGFKNGGIVSPLKLATGAIISQPGRGVPVSSAIAGESGAEGIIPLTNSQMMEQMGQTIAKYVNIQNVINTYTDTQRTSRVYAQSTNRNNIANNGG